MSTKERPKKEKKVDETVQVKKIIPVEIKKINVKGDENVVTYSTKSLEEKFRSLVPKWVNKPWMFILPTHESHLESWKESWRNLIINFAEHFNLHVLNTTELIFEFPFKNKKINKQITKTQIDAVVDSMVDIGTAEWLDDTHILIRIYFKPLDQWKEIIVNFLFDKGYAAEVVTIFELQNMDQEWSNLPRDDFLKIFNSLTEENRAQWADSNEDSIQLNV